MFLLFEFYHRFLQITKTSLDNLDKEPLGNCTGNSQGYLSSHRGAGQIFSMVTNSSVTTPQLEKKM